MRHGSLWTVGLIVALACAPARTQVASQPAAPEGPKSIWERETLTDGWFGAAPALAEKGLSFALTFTQIYQANVRGAQSTQNDTDRHSGRYDLEFNADMDKLAGLTGGRVYALARGGWSPGIDAKAIQGLFGVNADAFDEPVVLWQLYYEQVFVPAGLIVRVGRLDLTGGLECQGCKVAFDGNRFANDETGQFLNAALVNNPTIPFPAAGMAALVHVEPVPGWYAAAAAADANAVGTRSGFDTTFDSPSQFFSIYETGLLPRLPSARGTLQGAYRFGFWIDPRARERFRGGRERDTAGFYTSCDQVLWRPTDKADDLRGLGVFGRYGFADAHVNEVRQFWSAGLQYQGPLAGRDSDVLAVGVAQGLLSPRAELSESHETAIEAYYNMAVTPWLHVTPDFQYVFNPGGGSAGDAVVLGVRVQISF